MSEGNGDKIIIPGEPDKKEIKVLFQIEANEQGNLQFRNFSNDMGLLAYGMKIAELAFNSLIVTSEQAKRAPIVQAPPPGSFLNGLRGGFRKKR